MISFFFFYNAGSSCEAFLGEKNIRSFQNRFRIPVLVLSSACVKANASQLVSQFLYSYNFPGQIAHSAMWLGIVMSAYILTFTYILL